MKFRPNAVQPHLVEKPCRKCKVKTKALKNGQMQLSPICDRCHAEEERVFQLATLAANRQSRNRAHRQPITSAASKEK